MPEVLAAGALRGEARPSVIYHPWRMWGRAALLKWLVVGRNVLRGVSAVLQVSLDERGSNLQRRSAEAFMRGDTLAALVRGCPGPKVRLGAQYINERLALGEYTANPSPSWP